MVLRLPFNAPRLTEQRLIGQFFLSCQGGYKLLEQMVRAAKSIYYFGQQFYHSSAMCNKRKTMINKITGICCLFVAVAFTANAQDADRTERLEKEVQEIKLRLSKLESLLSNTSKANERVTSGEGWKSVMNWRRLTTNMDYRDVQIMLGEPYRVDGGEIATWYYQNSGEVTFMQGKVFQWREPRQ
ncbi:MAG: hypothetical protein HGA56_08195 [Chlorobiaceae bacterium]|nr:hypothetical protein [Chlorobiaceae bacterium]